MIVQPPIVVTTPAPSVPAPQVVVNVPEPPPPPARPHFSPAPICTLCPRDVATIGMPYRAPDYTPSKLRGASVDPDGCTIAAWTGDEVFASWDGGVTVATYSAPGVLQVLLTPRRLLVLRRNELAVIHPGAEPVWRDLGALTSAVDPSALWMYAAGDWILVNRLTDPLIAASDDDGVTWRYLTPPLKAQPYALTADGRIWAVARTIKPGIEPGKEEGPDDFTENTYVTDMRTARWREHAMAPRPPIQEWIYILAEDQFWGCGGSTKIVALHHGREVASLANDLRDEVYPVAIVSNGPVSYARYNQHLHRLRGTRSIDLGEVPDTNQAGRCRSRRHGDRARRDERAAVVAAR